VTGGSCASLGGPVSGGGPGPRPGRRALVTRAGGWYVADVSPAAAATSSSCPPGRSRGASCGTWPGRWRCGSRRSARRRWCRLADRLALMRFGSGASTGSPRVRQL